VRKRIAGIAARPRLAVYRSNRHIYAQLIDDEAGRTLASASSREAGFEGRTLTVDLAREVGARLGARAKEAGIDAVVFDRGGYPYHGRIQALADAAREAGLEF